MLIMTRRIGEKIIIGDREIEFTVLGVKGNQVRLGFEADKDISIHREEIFNRIRLENDQGEKLKITEYSSKNPLINLDKNKDKSSVDIKYIDKNISKKPSRFGSLLSLNK